MGQFQTKKTKNKRKFDPKEEHFIKNGGILLEKQIALSQGQDIGAQQLRIFSAKEIEEATNNYDPSLVAGSYHKRCVYIATLDERTVAVKAPIKPEPNSELVDIFLTEVATGMVLHHSNKVKLYGCCLETYIPLAVYEVVSDTCPFQYLKGQSLLRKTLNWNCHLQIATDIAYMLSYMHNVLSKPVVHRDLTSTYIIVDSSFHARLANFGYSVLVSPGKADRSLPIQGTPGYMDPEYVETREVSEKCDVFSFGVLLVELLTGRDPIEMAERGEDLAEAFVSAAENNCIKEMIDIKLLEQRNMNEIEQVVKLALSCVAKKGVERPTMIDVVNELHLIRNRDNK